MNGPDLQRVLLIEDNPLDARTIVRDLHATERFDVRVVGTLAAGLQALSEGRFDCVLLDLTLPDSDGLVSVDTVVARSPHCPVVVLTGLDDPRVAIQAVELGAQDYLYKTTMTGELLERAIRYAEARHGVETELVSAKQRLSALHAREEIARDLHDTVIQRLFASGMSLQASTRLESREQIVERVLGVVDEIDSSIRELRAAIFGLHSLDSQESFVTEVSAIVEGFRDGLEFDPVVRLGDIPVLGDALRADVLAVVREALSNVARHANASTATVSISVHDDDLLVRVSDNGRGGDELLTENVVRSETGNGLANMAERAAHHGGSLQVENGPLGGVDVTWRVPLIDQMT